MCNTDTLCFRIPELTTLCQYLYLDPANAVPYNYKGKTLWVSLDQNSRLVYTDPSDDTSKEHPLPMSIPLLTDIIAQLKSRPPVKYKDTGSRWQEIKSEISTPITMMLAQEWAPVS